MGHGRDFSNMNRRAARMLLLPLVLLFLMTPKVRSQARSGKSPKITGSKSAGKQSASQQTSPKSKSSTEDTGKWVESTLQEMSVEEKVGQLLFTTYHGSFTFSSTLISCNIDSTHLPVSSVEDLDFGDVCREALCFPADFEPAIFGDFPLRAWLRTFGVIRNRRTSGNSNIRAARLFILEKSLPCPMP